MKNVAFVIFALLIWTSCSKTELGDLDENNLNNNSTGNNLKSALAAYTTLVFEDNFDGTTLNPNNWFVGCKDPVSGDLIPGAKGSYLLNAGYGGYITNEDTYVQNGSLVLRNQKRTIQGTDPVGTFNYTTGWVTSMHRVFVNQGTYIEMRCKFPSGDKVWPALWLAAEDLVWGPEWDMFEYFGYRADVGYDNMGMHLMTGRWQRQKWYSYWLKPYDATYDCETWHVYGFEWTKTYAKWYIDGVLVHTLNAVKQWPAENMYLLLNNEVKADAPDATTTWPNTLEIDYVRIYR